MSLDIADEFKHYAEFSVRVDQFFHVVNTYASYHAGLKTASSFRPSGEVLEMLMHEETQSEEIKKFIYFAVTSLDGLKSTGIFSDAEDLTPGAIDPKTITPDLSNFAFYTCFCFQWSLFETLVKTMIQKLIDGGVLQVSTRNKLQQNWTRTKKFFDIIHSGEVFGQSPFNDTLPTLRADGKFEECDYSDLEQIRELRNSFIHGVESPDILPSPRMAKQQYYERSMWVLRLYARNVQFDAQKLLSSQT